MPSDSKLKFITDENLDSLICTQLAELFDVIEVTKSMPGAADELILARAAKEGRILITQDKDFGQLAYFYLQKHSGVILLRAPELSDALKAKLVIDCIQAYAESLDQSFVVVESHRVRIRTRLQTEE